MATNTAVCRGVVHGRIIELDDKTELPDGQQVEITVQPVSSTKGLMGRLPPGEGIRQGI